LALFQAQIANRPSGLSSTHPPPLFPSLPAFPSLVHRSESASTFRSQPRASPLYKKSPWFSLVVIAEHPSARTAVAMGSDQPPKRNQLAHSAYHSPYARSGAPSPHPNNDPYAPLRAKALATLEAMGYDPSTMVEHGVLWAEHQDPFGHVMHAQYMQFLGTCFHRVMESYSEHLDANEYAAMATGKSAIPAVRRYQLDIRRQVTYPDSVSRHWSKAWSLLTPQAAHRSLSPRAHRANP
jgi:hypothetical protein